MIRKCAICEKEFKCSPSDKIVTCGKECSKINKSRTHMGKSIHWNDESRNKLSKRGQPENLKLGTAAALKSPKSGRFATNVNAKNWHLISPEGEHYYFRSLNLWLRNNCLELFDCQPDSHEYQNVRSGLSSAKRAVLGGSYKCCTYKGWRVIPTDSDLI